MQEEFAPDQLDELFLAAEEETDEETEGEDEDESVDPAVEEEEL